MLLSNTIMLISCKFSIVFIAVILITSILKCNADRVKDTMYVKIVQTQACYRRMNSTSQIGCSSVQGGSVGVIHYCDKLSDFDFILKHGVEEQYIPVLSTSLFSKEVIAKASASKNKITGIILHSNDERPHDFSHEQQCPNDRFSVGATCPAGGWNPWGTGLLYADIPFPLFYVENKEEVMSIRNCFQKFNNFSFETQSERSLCSLELNAFMFATTNTPVCRRRSNILSNLNPVKLCDPLGDYNVWGSLFPLVEGPDDKPIKDYKYIIIASHMDTTTLLERTAGATNPITGVVALLTIAKLLHQILPYRPQHYGKNVLFVLFNGETYDYIGSQRLLYDMSLGQFPTNLPFDNDILPTIYPKDIALFIELSQLSVGPATFAHFLRNSSEIDSFVEKLQQANPSQIPLYPVPDSLPPSSLHTFLRNNESMNGLVLTNHKNEYYNLFYNSLYDNWSNIKYMYYNGSDIPENTVQSYVADVAVTVAKSVYQEVTGLRFSDDVRPNLALVDELFHCYLEDPNCKVHKAVSKGELPKRPLSLYVGVNGATSILTSLIALTLAWFTGDIVDMKGPNCTNIHKNHVYRYYNMSEDIDHLENIQCYKAVINLTEAVSPAFIIEDYDWSSNNYSSWTESTWNDITMRMYLKASKAQERTTLIIGFLTMFVSFILAYFVKSRSHILFDFVVSESSSEDC